MQDNSRGNHFNLMRCQTSHGKKLGSDLFELHGIQYCLVTDYYSKFPEIVKLGRNSTSKAVIAALKSVFSRHGIPAVLVTDNGPCYASAEFQQFTQEWEFKHVTSSPTYPRSNGMAERNVQTIKSLLMKADDPYIALLEYRTTPIEDIGLSPAQMLMGRRLNSKLPSHRELLEPQSVDSRQVYSKLRSRQQVQKKYYDRGTRELPPLKPGDTVGVWNDMSKTWKTAQVIEKARAPRSYIVATEEGSRLRRNRQHTRTSAEDQVFSAPCEPQEYEPPAQTIPAQPGPRAAQTTETPSPCSPVKVSRSSNTSAGS
jgi:transposase InsO family protein